MIPKFDKNGYLPPGIHESILDEFKIRFVEDMGKSLTRGDIFDGYMNYCRELSSLDVAIKQWVDGSFTTAKVNPNDIDMVSHIDALKICSRQHYDQVSRLLKNRDRLKSKYKCDPYMIFIYPPGHDLHDETIKWTKYWKNCFGRDREKKPKGMIEFALNDGTFVLDG